MSPSADNIVAQARRRIDRVEARELHSIVAAGGLVIDIRPTAQRCAEGSLPGAIVVERNVLEWRLDPTGTHRLPEVGDFDMPVVIVCSAGYASSLAAASLVDLGYKRAADLVGGYLAWRSWVEHGPVAGGSAEGLVPSDM